MQQTLELPGFEIPASPAIKAIDEALRAQFPEKARDFVLTFLRRHRDAGVSGEDLTDAMLHAGIYPPGGDGRSFGPVFQSMSQKGLIEVYGVGYRRKGNGTLGAAIWRVTAKGLKV